MQPGGEGGCALFCLSWNFTPDMQLGGHPFCARSKSTVDIQLGPNHFCLNYKPTLDMQLGVAGIFVSSRNFSQTCNWGSHLFLFQLQVHAWYTTKPDPFCPICKSILYTQLEVQQIYPVATPPPPCNCGGPPFLLSRLQFHLDMQLGPNPFFPSCKSTIDTQLRRLIFSQLEVQFQHATAAHAEAAIKGGRRVVG